VREKSLSILISALLVFAMGIAAIGLVWITMTPSINRSIDLQGFEHSKAVLIAVDGKITETASEGFGARKSLFLGLQKPVVFDDANDLIFIDLGVSEYADFFSRNAQQQQGNLFISRSGNTIKLRLSYPDLDLNFGNLRGLGVGNYNLTFDNNGLVDVNKTRIVIGVE
jgi:hypothetical protein